MRVETTGSVVEFRIELEKLSNGVGSGQTHFRRIASITKEVGTGDSPSSGTNRDIIHWTEFSVNTKILCIAIMLFLLTY